MFEWNNIFCKKIKCVKTFQTHNYYIFMLKYQKGSILKIFFFLHFLQIFNSVIIKLLQMVFHSSQMRE